jgi:hypothetical protein
LSTNFIDVLGVKRGAWKRLISCPKCAKTHLRASVIWKIFPGVIPPFKGRGGKEREDGRGKEGIRDTVEEEGVVWDREEEEGMRVIQRKGKGREGKQGRREKLVSGGGGLARTFGDLFFHFTP